MLLRAFVKANPETLSDFLLAADDRYREAEELLLAEEYDGCVYLLGYAAEMWLKSSCLRIQEVGPSRRVKDDALPALKKKMKVIAPDLHCSDSHDLSYFAECVICLRAWSGRPLPGDLVEQLRERISRGLHEEWIVEMRYRRSALTAADAWDALHNAWWMKTNWPSLS